MQDTYFNFEDIYKNFPQIVDHGYTEEINALSFSNFEKWINANHHSEMTYLSDERKEKRKNLKLVFSETQSALVFLFSYSDTKKNCPSDKVAGFALGFNDHDYHHVLKNTLTIVATKIQQTFNTNFLIAIDTLPILERDLAYRAGLGFIGKNSMLISPQYGSYVMIGSILFDKKLPFNVKPKINDHCGNCTRCLDACPTSALLTNRTLDSKKCIAYYTVEVFNDKSNRPGEFTKDRPEIFGCDICQDVCPWNKKVLRDKTSTTLISKSSLTDLFQKDKAEIELFIKSMSNNEFKKYFKGTSFFRIGKKGFLKNF